VKHRHAQASGAVDSKSTSPECSSYGALSSRQAHLRRAGGRQVSTVQATGARRRRRTCSTLVTPGCLVTVPKGILRTLTCLTAVPQSTPDQQCFPPDRSAAGIGDGVCSIPEGRGAADEADGQPTSPRARSLIMGVSNIARCIIGDGLLAGAELPRPRVQE
jgi:hypothetical protein